VEVHSEEVLQGGAQLDVDPGREVDAQGHRWVADLPGGQGRQWVEDHQSDDLGHLQVVGHL